jgi:hypothetical protein
VPGAPVTTEELLADVKRVASEADLDALSMELYRELGRFDASTVARRFGTWNKALAAAGLKGGNVVNYSDEALFENLMLLWEHYGRQPRREELTRPPSKISQRPYGRRFGSWMRALNEFAAFANGEDIALPGLTSEQKRQTSRNPTLRMRFRVLQRDGFKCRACGSSPALTPGVLLHVDHIQPWSAGGDTMDENLQTLCKPCNQGKGDLLP